MKKIVFAVIAAVILCAVPAGSAAEISGNFQYEISGGEAVITGFSGNDADVAIPETIGGKPVTGIKNNAFTNIGIVNLTIPKTVTNIGDHIIHRCRSLKNIHVDPDNPAYSSIDGVLYNKDKTAILKYPEGKTESSFVIPDGVILIGSGRRDFNEMRVFDAVFMDCLHLTSVTIPSSVTDIGGFSFYGCKNLPGITIPDSVVYIGKLAFWDCKELTAVTIPDSVAEIDLGAFYYCEKLATVALGSGLEIIRREAFVFTVITEITLPASVNMIADKALTGMHYLQEIHVAAENEKYASVGGVLYNKDKTVLIRYPINSPVTAFTIPDGVEKIHDEAFMSCAGLTAVTIPDTLTDIGIYAFLSCVSLGKIIVPDTVTAIHDTSFADCPNLTIYCVMNSYAHDFVRKNNIPYDIYYENPLLGNISGTGAVNISDVRLILQHLVGKIKLTATQLDLANVSGGETVTITDARLILQYLVGKITVFPRTPDPWPSIPAGPVNFDFFINEKHIDLASEHQRFEKNGTLKISDFHPFWRDFSIKEIPDPDYVNKLYDLRAQIAPAEYDKSVYEKEYLYIRHIVRYDDGWYFVFLENGCGVMGRSLDKLDRYFRYSDEFEELVRKLWRAYPHKYYTGEWQNDILDYELYFDAPDEVAVTLVSLENEKGTVTVTLDTTYDGTAEMRLTLFAGGGDQVFGSASEMVVLSGNKRIELTIEIWNETPCPLTIQLSNTVYNIRMNF
ncbi:MAG: leucine-rich repeat protein [Oscillospiraceae bacterium]|nr:leucine-rich repeat protein [Oscillospiraceae bacterium]